MKKLVFLFAVGFLFSCGEDAVRDADTNNSDEKVESVDTTEASEVVIDTLVEAQEDSMYVEPEKEVGEILTEAEIEKDPTALDFCTCVRKQKKIDDQMAKAESEEEFNAVLKAIEQIKIDCPILHTFEGSGTLEEKEEREKRKQACLGEY